MARIKGVTENEANEDVREVFEAQKKRHGFVSNAAQVSAVRPTIQKGVQALAPRNSGVGAHCRWICVILSVLKPLISMAALIELTVTHPGRCKMGRQARKVEALLGDYKKSPLFSSRERLALELAERMTYTGKRVTDRFFKRLKKHFTDEELVELAAVIALENFRSKFNPVFGVEANNFCPLPGSSRSCRCRDTSIP